MSGKNLTKPYKVVFTHPGQKTCTHPFAQPEVAQIRAAEIGQHGGQAVVEVHTGGTVFQIGAYGPGVEHTIEEVPVNRRWRCTCKASGDVADLTGHLHSIGMDPVVWSVVRGPSPKPRAFEPGPLDIDIPPYILAWAERHGADLDDPDVYVLVTPANEAGQVDGEIIHRTGALPEDDVETLRDKLAEQDDESFPS